MRALAHHPGGDDGAFGGMWLLWAGAAVVLAVIALVGWLARRRETKTDPDE
ncbi:MAG: hypothetical protein HYU41_04380 [Candidatus Rokubacteria bacterium]|nr:hypothetical protein [Candidatus Rokubacteria bacterium]